MGVVWQARDERLHRLVAVKQLLLQPDLSPQEAENARQRALREARIAARLQHPNAIVVYDVAEHDGEPCLVMEYLPSRTLGAVLAEQGCLPVHAVASIGKQVASALAAAHVAQIVHRDVKPGNILIAEGGTAKITDFGVSRAAGDVTVTQTGMMAGTPAYLAPEVARGQVPTTASDVFSLGATLFAAIEGQGPFGDGENQLALLHTVAAGDVAPPRRAGPLTPVLMGLLAKDPSARPDMQRASLELAAAVHARPVTVMSPAVMSPAAPAPPPAAGSTAPPTPAMSRPRPAAESRPEPPPPPVRPAVRPDAPDAQPVVPAPARPAATAGQGPDQDQDLRRRASVLAGVLLAVLTLAGVGGLLLGNISGNQSEPRASAPSTPPASSPEPAAPPPPPPPPTQTVPPPPPPTQTVPPSEGTIEYSAAGQLVIDYYNGLDDLSSAWGLLAPAARATFADEAEFRAYWSQYSSVSAQDAYGVTENSDGSVNVPVTVTYTTGSGTQVERRQLLVIKLGGELLIGSDPR